MVEIWLCDCGFIGIMVVMLLGFDECNVVIFDVLIVLGEFVMGNFVFVEIVGIVLVDFFGVGIVVNMNGMFIDFGVIGIKIGILVGWNLFVLKDVMIGEMIVYLFVIVLN